MAQKVLIIDDDEAIVTVFEESLKREGFEVTHALKGQEGIEKAKTENPSFILLDQVLPDMPGNEVLKTLKSTEQTKHIPVAILSNFGQNELIQDAIAHGAVNYLLKYQIEAQDLPNKVKELMQEANPNPGVTPPETGTAQ